MGEKPGSWDYNAVRYGDLLTLLVDNEGFLALPGFEEPLPQAEQAVSHVRAARVGEDGALPQHFMTRCVFQIVNDQGKVPRDEALVYGAIVRLVHHATRWTLTAVKDYTGPDRANAMSLRLKRTFREKEAVYAQFYILPRYSMRSEGDPVFTNDRIILESCRFRNAKMCLTAASQNPTVEPVVGLKQSGYEGNGFKINCVGRYNAPNANSAVKPDTVFGGQFVRFWHQELRAFLVSRADDEREKLSAVSPLGLLTRKWSKDPQETYGVYLRGNLSKDNALSVWQIMPVDERTCEPMKWGSRCKLLHVVTGQFLCIRGPTITDPMMSFNAAQCSVALTGPNDPAAVFEVHSVVDNAGEYLSANSSIHLVHPSTRFQLLPSPEYVMVQRTSSAEHSEIQVVEEGHRSSFSTIETQSTVAVEQRDWDALTATVDDHHLWWEYEHDCPLVPTDARTEGEVYRLMPVPQDEVEDILFVLRVLPLVKTAPSIVQQCKSMNDLPLQRFRHLAQALNHLISWVQGKASSDSQVGDTSAVDRLRDRQRRFLSRNSVKSDDHDTLAKDDYTRSSLKDDLSRASLAEATGRGSSVAKPESPMVFLDPLQEVMPSRRPELQDNIEVIRHRQELLWDTHVLQYLLHTATTLFQLHRHLKAAKKGALMYHDGNLPVMANNCCVLLYDLLLACVRSNTTVAACTLSLSGTLLHMIAQLPLGWNPPIEELLVTTRTTRESSRPPWAERVAAVSGLNTIELYGIMEQLVYARMHRSPAAVDLLHLIAVLCAPGQKPDLRMQFAVADFLVGDPSKDEQTLLFQSRLDALATDSASWEILLEPEFKLKPLKAPEDELREFFILEEASLRAAFLRYDADYSDALDMDELTLLLEDLGLSRPVIQKKAGILAGCSFDVFAAWWRRHRHIVNPTATRALTKLNVYDYLMDERRMSSASIVLPAESKQPAPHESGVAAVAAEDKLTLPPAHEETKRDEPRTKKSKSITQKLREKWDKLLGNTPKSQPGEGGAAPAPAKEALEELARRELSMSVDTSEHKASSVSVEVPRPQVGLPKHDPFDDDESDKESESVERSHFWRPAQDVLVDPIEGLWFRAAVHCLTGLCRGRNITCQRAASALLTAECTLAMLTLQDASDADRAQLCAFLVTCYVEHDFVFPTQALTPMQATAIAVQEERVQLTQAGKLFNNVTRFFRADYKPQDALELRRTLWSLLRQYLDVLYLVPRPGEDLRFQIALLQLVHALVLQGFFTEAELSASHAMSMGALGDLVNGPPLSHDNLSAMLVQKLRSSIDDYVASSQGYGQDNMDLIEAHYNRLLLLRDSIAAKTEALAILDTLLEIKQVSRAQEMAHSFLSGSNVDRLFPANAVYGDLELDDRVHFTRSQKSRLHALFSQSQTTQTNFSNAVLSTSLHPDPALQSQTYRVLYKVASEEWAFTHTLDELSFVVSGTVSRCHRVVNRLSAILSKYILFFEQNLADVADVLCLALDGLRAVCYQTWRRNAQPATNVEHGRVLLRRLLGGLTHGCIRSEPEAGRGSSNSPNADGMQLTEQKADVEEGGRELDIPSLRSVLLEYTSSMSQYLDNQPIHEHQVLMSGVVDEVLEYLRRLLRGGTRPLHSLDDSEQLVSTCMWEFLAAACHGNRDLVERHLLQHLEWLKWYMGSSRSVMILVAHMVACVSVDTLFGPSDLDFLFDCVTGADEDHPYPLEAVDALRNIVHCSREFVSSTAGAVIDRLSTDIVHNPAMQKYLLLDFAQPSVQLVAFHTKLIQLMVSCCVVTLQTPERFVQPLQEVLPLKLCCALVQEPIPLQLKTAFLQLVRLFLSTKADLGGSVLSPMFTNEEGAEEEVWNVVMPVLEACGKDMGIIVQLKEQLFADDAIGVENKKVVFNEQLNSSILEFVTAGALPLLHFVLQLPGYALRLSDVEAFVARCEPADDWMEEATLFFARMCEPVVGTAGPQRSAKSFGVRQYPQRASLVVYDLIRSVHAAYRTETDNALRVLAAADRSSNVAANCYAGVICILHAQTVAKEEQANMDRMSKEMMHALKELLVEKRDFRKDIQRNRFLEKQGFGRFFEGVRVTFTKRIVEAPVTDDVTDVKAMDELDRRFNFVPQLPVKDVKTTALFKLLRQHLQDSWKYLQDPDSFANANDFVLWTRNGGLYMTNLLQHLGDHQSSDSLDVTLLLTSTLCALLDSDVAQIRASSSSVQSKLAAITKEVERLQSLQKAVAHAGGHKLVMSVVAKAVNHPFDSDYTLQLLPMMLKFGAHLMTTGNDHVQEAFIDHFTYAVNNVLPEAGFIAAIRKLLRDCRLQIEYLINARVRENKWPLSYLCILVRSVFKFVEAMACAHNNRAQRFLREQEKSTEPVNIVADLSAVVHTIAQLLASRFVYITNEDFYNMLVPPSFTFMKLAEKRRFIAWHDDQAAFPDIARFFVLLSDGCAALTEMSQGPCAENQLIAARATQLLSPVLEYVGAMRLVVQGTIARRKVTWDGGNPSKFYDTYLRELARLDRLHKDPERKAIAAHLEKWQTVNDWRHKLDVWSGKEVEFRAADILGIDLTVFKHAGAVAERSILRLLLALLEGQREDLVSALAQNLDTEIVIQNMDIACRDLKASSTAQKEDIAVKYMSLVSTLASALRHDSEATLDDVFEAWQAEMAKKNPRVLDLIASVEIMGSDGRVQQVYFQVPKFVQEYWPYPQVQKAKEELLYTVNRESPDEKMTDFYCRMKGLKEVLRRQERLHRFFWVLHPLVGGKGPAIPFMPNQRVLLFFLTLALTAWTAYEDYREQLPWVTDPSVIGWVFDWGMKDHVFYILQAVHLGLTLSTTASYLLNSDAADILEPLAPPSWLENVKLVSHCLAVVDKFRAIGAVLLDATWLVLMGCFSLLAFLSSPILYLICLLDLIPQVRLMKFLVEAIRRNGTKILVTLLLACVILVLYGVLSYKFFQNQYNLDGHSDCDTLVTCFKLHLDYGITAAPDWNSDGIIEPTISGVAQAGEPSRWWHVFSVVAGTVYNLSYVIIVNMVLGAIISGLIIDTFGEMREENEEIEADIADKCFICSINRDVFDSAGVDYKEHIVHEHNMWKYLWFWVYLDLTDPVIFNGPENHAYHSLQDEQSFVKLIPIKKSLALIRTTAKPKEEESLAALEERLVGIEASQAALVSLINLIQRTQTTQGESILRSESQIADLVDRVQAMLARSPSFAEGSVVTSPLSSPPNASDSVTGRR